MAAGKQIGEFTLTETSRTTAPGSGGALTLQINVTGQISGAAGEGLGSGTMTVEYEPNMKSGTWSYCGMTAFNSGGGQYGEQSGDVGRGRPSQVSPPRGG